jgi:hypothetical protein
MTDAGAIDLDTGAVVEKHGRGHPRGSKNKPKDISMVALSSSASMKRCPGHPLGSKNKPKPSSSLARQSVDAHTARHNASPPPVNLFSFFVIAGAQCSEQQCVPLKFLLNSWTGASSVKPSSTKNLVEELHMRWRYIMTAVARCSSGAAGPSLQRIVTCIKDFFMLFNYHCGTSKFDVKIFDGTQCQKKYEAEVHFQ